MCRHIVFSGTCPHCTEHFVWEDLSQELSCLEAKNTGVFGQCAFGVQIEEHEFDQECEPCAAENERDEGYGGAAEGIDDELVVPPLGPGGELIIPDPAMKHLLAGKKHADTGGQQQEQQEEVGGGGSSGKSKTKKQRVANFESSLHGPIRIEKNVGSVPNWMDVAGGCHKPLSHQISTPSHTSSVNGRAFGTV
ncbi:hypothetical protein GE21DRAFT_3678 [Neurospora crassa]|uniref:Uncharacterized protein n=1 Tax=Neurospora crassa (strain ATCC 24698 / 74-OR23-1A / CBS 708.71 / DSM 1257 / FGSC 987) TaxID=367110 RepID=Q7S2P5_NEUCR|nr:hypothetical protein NCU09342 [Neurospora crassa OR74A]EAA29685.1 hypothetical protein NCU09342 [Neurospora crassa OR74A]KHE87266.1 hypothetical protein GE21DRAFT_3678 [Neurospora crassa]|eukprot:XP_958921.1 hypothetical protein NCU09342 [Neurospora crassa OR74A]